MFSALNAMNYLNFIALFSVRYRACYAVKIDDVVVDTRLFVNPTIDELRGRFTAGGLAGITVLTPLNNKVSIK